VVVVEGTGFENVVNALADEVKRTAARREID
jgi:hypothetical protein